MNMVSETGHCAHLGFGLFNMYVMDVVEEDPHCQTPSC